MSHRININDYIPRIFDVISNATEELAKETKGLPVFDASELMQYARSIEGVNAFLEDEELKNGVYAPQFNQMWIEGFVYIKDADIGLDELLEEMNDEETRETVNKIIGDKPYAQIAALCTNRFTPEHEDFGWSITVRAIYQIGSSYIDKLAKRPEVSQVMLSASVYHDGRIAGVLIDYDGKLFHDPNDLPEELLTDYGAVVEATCLALLTISLINQQTKVEKMVPNHRERKISARKMGQRGSIPKAEYYVVHVHPSKNVYPPRPTKEKGPKKSRHGVMGHYRRISSKGLFGKGYKAGKAIWIPPHIRGDSSIGTIEKDYKIHGNNK